MKTLTSNAVLAALLFLAAGCSGLRSDRPDPFAGGDLGATYLYVLVDNRNREDVNLEVAFAGSRQTLGVVAARSWAHFRVEMARTQEIQLSVNLVAGSRHNLRGVSASPGDTLEVIVVSPVSRSLVRRR